MLIQTTIHIKAQVFVLFKKIDKGEKKGQLLTFVLTISIAVRCESYWCQQSGRPYDSLNFNGPIKTKIMNGPEHYNFINCKVANNGKCENSRG